MLGQGLGVRAEGGYGMGGRLGADCQAEGRHGMGFQLGADHPAEGAQDMGVGARLWGREGLGVEGLYTKQRLLTWYAYVGQMSGGWRSRHGGGGSTSRQRKRVIQGLGPNLRWGVWRSGLSATQRGLMAWSLGATHVAAGDCSVGRQGAYLATLWAKLVAQSRCSRTMLGYGQAKLAAHGVHFWWFEELPVCMSFFAWLTSCLQYWKARALAVPDRTVLTLLRPR